MQLSYRKPLKIWPGLFQFLREILPPWLIASLKSDSLRGPYIVGMHCWNAFFRRLCCGIRKKWGCIVKVTQVDWTASGTANLSFVIDVSHFVLCCIFADAPLVDASLRCTYIDALLTDVTAPFNKVLDLTRFGIRKSSIFYLCAGRLGRYTSS